MIFEILFTTFVAVGAWAKPLAVDPSKMSAVVRAAYDERMDQAFLDLANDAKKSKKASDFLIERLRLGEDDAAYLRKNLGDTPPPKIWKIKDGFEVSVNDRKFKVQRGAFGEVTLDDKAVSLENSASLRETIEAFEPKTSSVGELLIPRAEAWVVPAMRLLYYGARAGLAWWAASTAANVGTGVVLGCAVGTFEGPQDETWAKRCKDGAAYGKVAAWDEYGKSSKRAMGLRKAASQADNAQVGLGVAAGVTLGKVALLNKAVSLVGPLGIFAGLYQVGEDVLTMNGAQVTCGENGGYALTSLKTGQAQHKLLYHLGNGDFMMGGKKISLKDEAAIKKFLVEELKLPADIAGPSAKAILKDHTDRVAICEKNPDKVFKVMSADTQKLNAEPAQSGSVK